MAEKYDLELFIKAVRSVTLDNGFDLATEKAQRARLTAHRLLKYCEANEKVTGEFAKKLLNFVRACCSHPRPVTCHTFKERMWEKFYKLCAKEEFNTMWKTFIQSSIGFNGSPIFYQFVTRAILEEQVKIQFPTEVPLQPGASYTVTSLDFEDSSALRYCGGYIIRSLKKKIGKSAHPLRDALLLCLNDLIEEDDENAEPSDSEKWLKAIDRGGLISIDDCMFGFLVAIEIELRNHLTTSYSVEQSLKSVIPKIIGNEDVLCYWDMVSINWSTVEAKELLNLIVEHYTTIRGFSFAKAFMEKYKQSTKKTTQKSKGLRKKLDTGSTSTSSKVYNDE